MSSLGYLSDQVGALQLDEILRQRGDEGWRLHTVERVEATYPREPFYWLVWERSSESPSTPSAPTPLPER